jgi:hypothetical protein
MGKHHVQHGKACWVSRRINLPQACIASHQGTANTHTAGTSSIGQHAPLSRSAIHMQMQSNTTGGAVHHQ